MKKTVLIFLSATVFACNSAPIKEITGTYVREQTSEQKHYNTGKVLGTFQTLDTIFITKKVEGFQIENHVWRKNSYDQDGWQQKHEGMIRTHGVKFDKTDNSLNTEMSLYEPMYLDFDKKLLFYSRNGRVWKKINN